MMNGGHCMIHLCQFSGGYFFPIFMKCFASDSGRHLCFIFVVITLGLSPWEVHCAAVFVIIFKIAACYQM